MMSPLPPRLLPGESVEGGLLRERNFVAPPPPPLPSMTAGRVGVRYDALFGGSGVTGKSRDWELRSRCAEHEVLVLVPGETESAEEETGEDGMLTGASFWLRRRELGKRGWTLPLLCVVDVPDFCREIDDT